MPSLESLSNVRRSYGSPSAIGCRQAPLSADGSPRRSLPRRSASRAGRGAGTASGVRGPWWQGQTRRMPGSRRRTPPGAGTRAPGRGSPAVASRPACGLRDPARPGPGAAHAPGAAPSGCPAPLRSAGEEPTAQSRTPSGSCPRRAGAACSQAPVFASATVSRHRPSFRNWATSSGLHRVSGTSRTPALVRGRV